MKVEDMVVESLIKIAIGNQIPESKLFDITDENELNNIQYSKVCESITTLGYDIVPDSKQTLDSNLTPSKNEGNQDSIQKEKTMIVYTVKEVADILKVSESTINRLVKSNKIESFRIGTVTRITEEAILKFIKSGGATCIDDSSDE